MPAAARTCDACGATGQYEAFCEECGEALPIAIAEPSAPVATPGSAPVPGPAPVSAPAAGPVTAPLPVSTPPLVTAPPLATAPAGEQPVFGGNSGDTWDIPFSPSVSAGSSSADDRPTLPSFSTDRAHALVVPVDDPSGQPSGGVAAPKLPGRPEAVRPVTVQRHETDTMTSGVSCPWCSALNPVDRHFCRRCASSLAERPGEAGPVRLPWWRRLFDRNAREIPYAGQRPVLRRNPGQLTRWIVTLAVAVIVVVAASVWGPGAINGIEDHFAHPASVFANSVTASHSDPDHPVSDLHDSYNNTWWGTGETGDGAGVHVDATFNQPIDLLDIVITPGAGITPDAFTSQSRPQQIQVTLLSADGSTSSQTINLADSPGPQTFAIHGSDVTSIRFTLVSAYLASTGPHTEVAIAEIEFFAKA